MVYQSMQNLYQLVKYSLINSWNWIHVMFSINFVTFAFANFSFVTTGLKTSDSNYYTNSTSVGVCDCWLEVTVGESA